ncbi:MAG: class IV adenylate cyclase [Acidobacteria bacterium]|nr:class IV adenylate cyclase [Acidobacteriota bacterium]
MSGNIEIKAYLRTDESVRRAQALADGPAVTLDQRDYFLATDTGRLKLRVESGRAHLIHYHRSNQPGPKYSQYVITPIEDVDSFLRDHRVLGVVEKRRCLLKIGQTRIHIDEVKSLGKFLELEVVMAPNQTQNEAKAITEDLMARLSISDDDLIADAYFDLLYG